MPGTVGGISPTHCTRTAPVTSTAHITPEPSSRAGVRTGACKILPGRVDFDTRRHTDRGGSSKVRWDETCGGREGGGSRAATHHPSLLVLLGEFKGWSPARPLSNMNDAMVTHISSGAPTPTKRSQHIMDTGSRLPDEHALIADYVARLRSGTRVLDSPSRLDEEHRLIARYAARLAAEAGNSPRPPTELSFNFDANKQQRQLIAELENKNREILQEIQRLRLEHEQASQPTPEKAQQNPTLLAELRLLRQRKDELEQRMSALQESRRELMVQLEGLMKLLKAQAAGSPRSSPSHGANRSMPMPVRSTSAGSTPTHGPQDSIAGMGDVQEAFAHGARRNLRSDLLVAADSITNTMSSLVKELHSAEDGADEEEEKMENGKDRG